MLATSVASLRWDGHHPRNEWTTSSGTAGQLARNTHMRLDEIRAAMQRLSDPRRTPEPEARKLMAGLGAFLGLLS